MTKSNPFVRRLFDRATAGADEEVDVARGSYLYWIAPDGTEIKVEMVDGQLMIWNQGNTANFSLSVQPVSSNVVRITPTR